MSFLVSEQELGTAESDWLASDELAACRTIDWTKEVRTSELNRRAVVLAPHPDDEVLALGGTMIALVRAGFSVDVVAITDGEASHPRLTADVREQLGARRAQEQRIALSKLDIGDVRVQRLHLPDGLVAETDGLAETLEPVLQGAALCFAPWERDGHPDHDATGRAARIASHRVQVRLIEYPVWAWHWATPHHSAFPWERAARVELDESTLRAKERAIDAYTSQIAPLVVGDAPVLPRAVLARFRRPFETVFA